MNLAKKFRFYNYLATLESKIYQWFYGLPCTVTNGVNAPARDYNLYGNSTQNTIVIDNVEYKVPDGYTVLESALIPARSGSNKSGFNTGFTWADVDYLETCTNLSSTQKGSSGNIIMCGNSSSPPETSFTSIAPYINASNTSWATSGLTNFSASPSNATFDALTKYTFSFTSSSIYPIHIGGWVDNSWNNNYYQGYLLFKKNNVVVGLFVPMKNSSNVVGFYDFVSKVFRGNQHATMGEVFTAGSELPMPSTPVPISNVGDKVYDIPYDQYEPVEYIQSSGRQYINTGVSCNFGTRFEFSYELLDSSRAHVYGNNANSREVLGWNTVTGEWYLAGQQGTLSPIPSINVKHDIIVDLISGQSKMYLNGVVYASSTGTNIGNTGDWLLFAINRDGRASFILKQKYYNFKAYTNNTLVRNLIPVKKLSNNEYGMFDTVTQTFFGNAGTGSFTGGNAVAKYRIPVIQDTDGFDYNLYDRVEYLQSSGEQYIDTGYTPSSIEISSELDFEILSYMALGTTWVGTNNSDGFRGFRIFVYSNQFAYDYTNSDGYCGTPVTIGQRYKLNTENEKIYVDGVYKASRGKTEYTFRNPIFLFALNNGGSASLFSQIKIYNFKFSDNGLLVRNMIPCYRKSDSKPGMYDTVTNQFFTNANTSATTDFTAGSIINPTTTNIYLTKPLPKLGTKLDKINYKDQTLTMATSYYEFTGEETFTSTYSTQFGYVFTCANILSGVQTTATASDMLCTHFKNSGASTDIKFSFTSGTNLNFAVQTTWTSTSDFKAWLTAQKTAGTPVTVYYPLQTDVTIGITTPTGGVALPSLTPYAGTTYFTVGTEVQPFVDSTIKGLEIEAQVSS